MSGKKKPSSNRSKGQPPKRRQRSQPAQGTNDSADYDSKDLSPATVTLILCVVLAIGGGVIWYTLSADRDPIQPLPELAQNSDGEKDKKAQKGATPTPPPAVKDKKW